LSFLRVQKHKLWIRDLWFEGVFNVSIQDHCIKLFASKGDYSTHSIFWEGLDGGWDAQSIKLWSELSKYSNVIFDIGANIGLYALVAKTANPESKVYAFEPARKTIGLLKKNVIANKIDISVIEKALSNSNGVVEFYDLDIPTAMSSLKNNENLMNNKNSVKYEVDVITFESFIQEHQIEKVDLISIDVEMNEAEVLEGMGDLIQKFQPNFIIEVLNNDVGAKIESYFENLSYMYFRIDEQSGLSRVNHLSRPDDEITVHRGFNFLICSGDIYNKLDLNDK